MQLEMQLAIELLLIASIVAIVVKYVNLPYTVALVIVGLCLSLARLAHIEIIPGSENLALTKDLVFLIFLPPLLFEGAINMDLEILRRNKLYVALLAILGTLITCIFFGATLTLSFGFALIPALLIGSILAPTDPVSVLALFKEHGVDKDLSTIVEGESVFNDGLGVVLYLVLIELVGGTIHDFSFSHSLATMFWEVGVGAIIGLGIGFIVHKILGKIDDHLAEVTISLVLAYGVYILADRVHASGVIAVVCAGLIMGNFGKFLSMSPTTRLTLTSFWEVAAFLINSLLFLLLGIEFHFVDLVNSWKLVLALFVLLIIFRAIVVYGIFAFINFFRDIPPLKWLHVINWGGLRGSIPIALALGLPNDLTITMGDTLLKRQDIISIVFGVVLLSLLTQGLSIKLLLDKLGLSGMGESPLVYERMLGKHISLKAALESLDTLFRRGEVSQLTHEKFHAELLEESYKLSTDMREFLSEHHEVHDSEYATIARSLLLSQRASLQEAFHRGVLSEHTSSELIRLVDAKYIEGEKPNFEESEKLTKHTVSGDNESGENVNETPVDEFHV